MLLTKIAIPWVLGTNNSSLSGSIPIHLKPGFLPAWMLWMCTFSINWRLDSMLAMSYSRLTLAEREWLCHWKIANSITVIACLNPASDFHCYTSYFQHRKAWSCWSENFFLSFLSTGLSIFPFFLLKFFSYSYWSVTFFSQLCSPYQCIYNYAIYCYCIHAYFYTLFGLLPPRQSVHLQHPLGSHVLSSIIKYIELKHVRNS